MKPSKKAALKIQHLLAWEAETAALPLVKSNGVLQLIFSSSFNDCAAMKEWYQSMVNRDRCGHVALAVALLCVFHSPPSFFRNKTGSTHNKPQVRMGAV